MRMLGDRSHLHLCTLMRESENNHRVLSRGMRPDTGQQDHCRCCADKRLKQDMGGSRKTRAEAPANNQTREQGGVDSGGWETSREVARSGLITGYLGSTDNTICCWIRCKVWEKEKSQE